MARASRNRNRRSSRRSRNSNHTGMKIFGAILALGVIGGAFYWQSRVASEMSMDDMTLCPTLGPTGMITVLFDLTDPLSSAQAAQLRGRLDHLIDNAPTGTQFTLGIVSSDHDQWGASKPLCKPHSADNVSSLTQNTKLVERRYEKDFLTPLHNRIAQMINASGSATSPIMESLQALVAETHGFITFNGPRQIVVISDLLQNSQAMSFYRGDDWRSFSVSPNFARLGRNLDDAYVTIFKVPRPQEKIRDVAAIDDFWIRYFDLEGAHVPKVVRLGDL